MFKLFAQSHMVGEMLELGFDSCYAKVHKLGWAQKIRNGDHFFLVAL